MHVRAGRLRHRVDIQEVTRTRDGPDVDTSWRTIASVRASISPLSGREFFEAQRVQSDVTHQVGIRTLTNYTITPKHRIKWGSRVFEILSIRNIDERNRLAVISAKESV